MLLDYPEREYPEEEELDPKKKKDKKKEEKKPKKKKKGPPFPTPEWATELDEVVKTVKNMENLVNDKQNLHLSPRFCERVNDQLARFKKEINFRRAQEEEERLAAELKKLKAKKKK